MVGYETLPGTPVPVKMWTEGLGVEHEAQAQLRNIAALPVVFHHVAVMPDVHWGRGATVGSVIPTIKAIIPAAVGVDIGCGMMALETDLDANRLDGRLKAVREVIERQIPVGGPGVKGSWEKGVPKVVEQTWDTMFEQDWRRIADKHPRLKGTTYTQLGTLGTGNHFIEVCVDERARVWLMLHSGSRGIGNRIGTFFIERAKEALERGLLPTDTDLAWLREGTDLFDDYVGAVGWAQRFASANRQLMMANLLSSVREAVGPFDLGATAVNCHHNYVRLEDHFGESVWVTRKGAVSAAAGELGIIPGSMGARSYIVEGLGNPESFRSCSHGAGRRMSRGAARRAYTVADHAKATEGVECRKDAGVLDETPAAYKDIDAVMAAQADLVRPVRTLKQVVCVKG